MLIDTHCHIQTADYGLTTEEVLKNAQTAGVERCIAVGTTVETSAEAIACAKKHKEAVFAAIGLHPNDTHADTDIARLVDMANDSSVIAIGECGLDYYYLRNTKQVQHALLKSQLELAKAQAKPCIFHIRGSKDDASDAFNDFWDVYDRYKIPGVVHSFSANKSILEQITERNLFVGVNGIATFTKLPEQLEAYRQIPLKNLLLETDAPLLTPVPFRGTINEPKHISVIVRFLSQLRGESEKQIAVATTINAERLFKL